MDAQIVWVKTKRDETQQGVGSSIVPVVNKPPPQYVQWDGPHAHIILVVKQRTDPSTEQPPRDQQTTYSDTRIGTPQK